MKFQLFSVLDLKSGVFLSPFVSRSEVDAKRQIAASLLDPQIKQTPVGQNPSDFALYRVGAFDDEAGTLFAEAMPTLVEPLSAMVSTVSS